MKKLAVKINGQSVEGCALRAKNGVLWVHLNGQTFTYGEETGKRRGRKGGPGSGASLNPGEVAAPMPGKIVKVLVQKGEAAIANQVLLVMEAMKMEYTLKSPGDGTVAEVTCKAGDQVALGQVLIKMEVP